MTTARGELLRNLYGVLGLRPEARDDQIKAAFRIMAKQCHPDLYAGDKRAEERFKDVNEAYAILSDPGARARYDASLSQRRSLRWQRSRNAAPIMAASFALTVISTAIVLQRNTNGLSLFSAGWQAAEPPPTPGRRTVAISEAADGQQAVALPETKRAAEPDAASPVPFVDGRLVGPPPPGWNDAPAAAPDIGSDAWVAESDRAAIAALEVQEGLRPPSRLPSPDAGKSREKLPSTEPGAPEVDDHPGKAPAAMPREVRTGATSWASYRNARFGFALRYPADIFVLEPAQSDDLVKHFRSRDGRATLRIVAAPNVAGRTLAQYRTTLIQERYGGTKFDYAPQRETWFVLSGVTGDDIFYERVTFACDRRSLHGWTVVFPSAERLLYEPIIEEMHRKYRHSNGPGARCGAMKSQVSAGTRSSGGPTDGSL